MATGTYSLVFRWKASAMRISAARLAWVPVVLLLSCGPSSAAAPLRPDDCQVPPDRGRLFIKDPMIFKGLLDDLRTQSAGPSKRINAIGIFVRDNDEKTGCWCQGAQDNGRWCIGITSAQV